MKIALLLSLFFATTNVSDSELERAMASNCFDSVEEATMFIAAADQDEKKCYDGPPCNGKCPTGKTCAKLSYNTCQCKKDETVLDTVDALDPTFPERD